MSGNQVTLFANEQAGQLSKKFGALAAAGIANDLGDGIRGGYAIVGIKAGKFRLKYKGEETVLTTDGTSPVAFIDVVIVKANAFLNKQYFEGKYVEGANAAPVCYSLDGVSPSEASTKKQATACALCPKNQFGSLVGDNGVKQKACRDTKKLAIVPAADIRNATMGGAMLFRVPPSSLKDLSVMADQLKGRGYPYNSVVVRISFDLQASHPKPVFRAQRALTDEEADQVLEMFESDSVQRVLADNDVAADSDGTPAPAPVQPVQPAMPPRVAAMKGAPGSMPPPEETGPAPQAAPKLVDAAPIQDALAAAAAAAPRVVQPAAAAPVAPPPVQPAVNPFARPAAATAAVSAPAAAAAPAPAPSQPAAANPFQPPPAAKTRAKRAPVTVEAEPAAAAEPVTEDNSALSAEINSIIAGLGLDKG